MGSQLKCGPRVDSQFSGTGKERRKELIIHAMEPCFAASSEYHPHAMGYAVIDEVNLPRSLRHRHAVEFETGDVSTYPARFLDRNLIARGMVSEGDFVAGPAGRNARLDQQLLAL